MLVKGIKPTLMPTFGIARNAATAYSKSAFLALRVMPPSLKCVTCPDNPTSNTMVSESMAEYEAGLSAFTWLP